MITCITAKNPLRYQISQCDCVPVAFLNAISCLYKRNEIPADLIRLIYSYSLDNISKQGVTNGSSIHAVELLSHYISKYRTSTFKTDAVFKYGQNASIAAIDECLSDNGVVVLELQTGKNGRFWHYLIAMGYGNENYYCFDSYYKRMIRGAKHHVRLIKSNGFQPNMSINRKWIKTYRRNKTYCFGSTKERVLITMNRHGD